jgi:hypothetical protein
MSRPGAHQAALAGINAKNRAAAVRDQARDQAMADSSLQRGFPRVKEVSSPQDQQAGIKKLSAKLAEHYRRR